MATTILTRRPGLTPPFNGRKWRKRRKGIPKCGAGGCSAAEWTAELPFQKVGNAPAAIAEEVQRSSIDKISQQD